MTDSKMPMMLDDHLDPLGGGMPSMDDDLFGDEVLPIPSRPPSKQLQQRVDEMRSRGCCRYGCPLRPGHSFNDAWLTWSQEHRIFQARHHSIDFARWHIHKSAMPSYQPHRRVMGVERANALQHLLSASAGRSYCPSFVGSHKRARACCH